MSSGSPRHGWAGVWALVLAGLLAGCQLTKQPPFPETVDRSVVRPKPTSANASRPMPTLEHRLVLPPLTVPTAATGEERLFSFAAANVPIAEALRVFANAYRLNLVVDPDVEGLVTVEFHDLPLELAMSALISSLGLYFEEAGGLMRVRASETRTFELDYIRLVRGGTGMSLAQVSSGSSSDSSGDDGGGDSSTEASTFAVEQEDRVEFWEELEQQLAGFVSETGRVVVNRVSGTVQVTDSHPRVEEVARYIEALRSALHRQVDVEVRIVEVTLRDDNALGINWSRVVSALEDGFNISFTGSTIIAAPAGGFVPAASTLNLDMNNSNAPDTDLRSIVDALSEQGKVRVVSQPHVRTLNNQTGMIKVGTDRTFFRREQTTDTSAAGATTFATDVPQVVTEGVVLAITPQISADGWIMLDLSPVVTRVSSIEETRNDAGVVQSRAPNLDIRQAASLVRVRSGETVVVGGLIQNQRSDTARSIPFLSSIPVIGNLFRGQFNLETNTELVMFLTPRLVDGPGSPK